MNIQQRIKTSHRNQPVHWEHTINIQAIARGTTKREELKRVEGEAFKTKATAAECTERHLVQKASRQRLSSRSHLSPRPRQEQGWYQQQKLQHSQVLPCAWFTRLYQIRQPKLFEFQVFPLRVWFNCLAIQAHARSAVLWSGQHQGYELSHCYHNSFGLFFFFFTPYSLNSTICGFKEEKFSQLTVP